MKVMAKKIKIKPSKSSIRNSAAGMVGVRAWTKSPPFVVNPRGKLIHRVRHVSTYIFDGKESHVHVTYLCGNGCNLELRSVNDALVSDPPDDMLLCSFCEDRAARAELPTGDELAGRHVHRGILVARQTCCKHPEYAHEDQ